MHFNLTQQQRSPITNVSTQTSNRYRGRFAPSPSGLLHFGSLIAALASFLDAKSFVDENGQQGQWLVRIDDIDPPREKKGASAHILKTLEAYGLHWDEDVLYQSTQTDLYNDVLSDLAHHKLSYNCQCTRAQIKAIGGIYQGVCKPLNLSNATHNQNHATRLVNQSGIAEFNDVIQGQINCDSAFAKEDFILKRKDGLFAYQLAVVVDELYQNITHVIRGCDLLEPTVRQLSLFTTLKQKAPIYGHFPVAAASQGFKLSKQNKAPTLDHNNPQSALIAALNFLGQQPDKNLVNASVDEIISSAISHWQRNKIPQQKEIII